MNILITGAAQGIGAAIATNLALSTNKLFLVDLQKEKLDTFVQTLSSKCEVVQLVGDLTQKDFLNILGNQIKENNIEVIINNAGFAPTLKAFQDLSDEEFEFSFKINVHAPFKLIQAAIAVMNVNGKGMILNVASRSNIYGYKNMAVYAATKSAISSFTGTVALENPNIKAITIIPGRTNTQMQSNLRGVEEAQKSQDPALVGSVIAQVVSGEIPTNSGEFVIIDFGNYKVMPELDKADLHSHMH